MGGGKGTVGAETASPVKTTTPVGNKLDAVGTTFDDTIKDRRKSVDKKSKGTRGLRIPLESTKSITKPKSAEGVQL